MAHHPPTFIDVYPLMHHTYKVTGDGLGGKYNDETQRACRILHPVVGTLVIQLSGYDSDDLLQRSARKLRRYGMPSKSHSCTHPVIHALIQQRRTSY